MAPRCSVVKGTIAFALCIYIVMSFQSVDEDGNDVYVVRNAKNVDVSVK